MIKRSIFFALLFTVALGANFVGWREAHAQTIVPLSSLASGDLVRGQTFPAVYYFGADGFRYVFPNDKAYFTWYSNFDSVKWVSDVDLGKIQIGGNVTYKPGVKMIKIDTDPKTYAVGRNGELRWVTTEAAAIGMYGSDWNKKIHDVPDSFFGNYHRGTDIAVAADFVPSTETSTAVSVNWDKDLKAPTYVSVTDSGYSQNDISIVAGTSVKWTNNGSAKHTVTADNLQWGSGTMDPGVSFIKKFGTSGTFTYFDSYDTTNTGSISVVQP